MRHPRIDPSPTALRSPLSPRERATVLFFIPLQGERGDRKAVGEGVPFNPNDFDGTPNSKPIDISAQKKERARKGPLFE